MTPKRLNFAGQLAKIFITSKLTVVFIVATLALGVLAVLRTPREENPQILMPAALVTVSLPGASADEVEELVVTPLEGILGEMTGVDHTYGTAQNSLGVVQVIFEVGQDKEDSLVKLYDRVMSNLGRLPADAGQPQISSVDADDVPIVTVTLASARYSDYELKRLADRMAERLRSAENVSVVTVHGGRDREFSIELNPERLQAFGVSLSQVYAAFNATNLSVPFQRTVRHRQIEAIKLQSFFTSVEDVRNQIVGVHEGRPVYVRDIAVVRDGPPVEIERYSRFSFGPGDPRFNSDVHGDMPAVTLAVAKKKGANAVTVANSVLDRIERLKASIVPEDVHVIVTRDDGQKANDAVNLLIEHLGIAIVTVSIMLIFFLGWREAMIVTLTIPLVFSITLAADLFGGVTINRVTLFALILSLGLLVDAAIVVIENIHRHYKGAGGEDKLETTVEATNEIGNATNLATLAVMVVFASLLVFLTDMPSQYFYPVGFNVPIAMATSVMVAYIVTPWAANRWLGHHAEIAPEKKGESQHGPGRLQRLYLKLMRPLQESLGARLGLAALIAVCITGSLLQGAWQFIRPSGLSGPQSFFGVNLGFLPKDNKNTFNIVINMPATAPVEETDRLVRAICRLLEEDENVINFQSWVGQSGVADFNALFQGTANQVGDSIAEIRVNLVDKHERTTSSIDLVYNLRPKVEAIRVRYPEAKIRLVEDPPGPPLRAMVVAEVYGPDREGLRILAAQVKEAFCETWDMVDLTDSEPVDVREHHVMPDREKAALSGVSVAQIAQVLQLVYGGDIVSRAHPSDEKNPVSVRAYVPRRYEVDPTRLDRIFVDNVEGRPVPVSELVRIESARADRPVQRKDNERVSFVGGEMARSVALYAVLDLDRRVDGILTPDGRPLTTGNLKFVSEAPDVIDGYRLLWEGEMRMELDVYRDLGLALGAALTVVFLMLVAYYKSFLIPLVAMSSVPLGIIGIFPGHWLMGVDFSATSIVGIVALSGVVVRNSLLIIDFIQDNMKKGMPLKEAAAQAGAVRLRPILLVALAIVFGSVIMVADPVFGGLAISLIFGTVVSASFTVFVVPLLYCLVASRQNVIP